MKKHIYDENDEKIEKIKQKLFNNHEKNEKKHEIVNIMQNEKAQISPPTKAVLKNNSDFSESFENLLKFSPLKDIKTNYDFPQINFIEKEKKVENSHNFQNFKEEKHVFLEKKPALSPKKAINFKEKIKKLKAIYHDKNFINILDEKEPHESSLKIENIPQFKQINKNNFQNSLNFSESKNFSEIKNEMTPIKNEDKQSNYIENNSSLVKRIDFESELNYSISQSGSPIKLPSSDPILTSLYEELAELTSELE